MHQAQWSPERPLPPPVSLTSQSHHEMPPEVTCTSRGNPGFPASTRERPRETFFNTSRGQIPLPWLGSNDALPLATRMETRLPWRPTRVSLTSPSLHDIRQGLDIRILAFRNETVLRYNRDIHDAVHGSATPFAVDEIVMLNDAHDARDATGRRVPLFNQPFEQMKA